MTGTVTSTVYDTYGDIYSSYKIGDVFTLTFTYDSDGTEKHFWNDGVNNRAEFGNGDDTIKNVYPMPSSGYTTWTNLNTWAFTGIDVANLNQRDATNYNTANIDTTDTNITIIDIRFDGVFIQLDAQGQGNYSWYHPAGSSTAAENFYVTSTFTSTPTNPIPEPATMLLFGTGLAGLAGRRLSRKKKS